MIAQSFYLVALISGGGPCSSMILIGVVMSIVFLNFCAAHATRVWLLYVAAVERLKRLDSVIPFEAELDSSDVSPGTDAFLTKQTSE